MNLGFCRIMFVFNFIPNIAVRYIKYFILCHVLSLSMFRVGYNFTFTELLSSYIIWFHVRKECRLLVLETNMYTSCSDNLHCVVT